jgi:anti-anti-sigma regulatory factor
LRWATSKIDLKCQPLVIAMRTRMRRDDGGAVINVAGTFDTTDVNELGMLAGSLYSVGNVVLDFHDVEVLSDCAIAKLAIELHRREPGHVTLVGLSEHHHRLLQYVGAEAAATHRDPEANA